MKRAALSLLAVLVLAAGLVQWRAPQIAVLLAEGFPGPVWPASGQFAQVAGSATVTDPPLAPPPPDAALTRLAESDGRALLMSKGGVLRAETYAEGFGRDTLLNSYSMVKSLVGTLVLRAVADGCIAEPFAFMTGLEGQMVYLIPGNDTVVVRFGAQVQLLHSTIYDLFPARD